MPFGKYNVDYEQRLNMDRLRTYRVSRTHQAMEEFELDGFLTFNADSIRYITSAYITTPMRPIEVQGAFISRTGDPYFYGGGTPTEEREKMPWLKGQVFPSRGTAMVARSSYDGVVEAWVSTALENLAAEGVTPINGKQLRVGIESSCMGYFVEAFARKGAECVFARPMIMQARSIKNEDEINIMKLTCANAEKAFARIKDFIRPGVRECDIVGVGLQALYEEGCDHTEDLVCMSGHYTYPYNWTFTDRMVRPGDLIYIDVDGASYLGYKSCYYRTFSCGRASSQQNEVFQECMEMMDNALKVVKPGNTIYQMLDTFPEPSYWGRETWSEVDALAMAHGLGLGLHELPHATRTVQKVSQVPDIAFQPGHVMAIETYAGSKDGKFGVRQEDMFVVTEDGYELISKWPRDKITECWV